MANGLLGQIARGTDVTTPLLQGAGFVRGIQQDVLRQQQQEFVNQQVLAKQQALQAQAIQKQKEAAINNLNTNMKSLLEFGEVDAALDVFGEINKLTGVGGNIDINKLKASQKAGRLNFPKLTQALTKIMSGDKNSTDESKKAGVDVFTSILQREGGVDAALEAVETGEVSPVSGDRPELAQAEVQPQIQPEVTPQQTISALRQFQSQVEAQVVRTPQDKANKKAILNQVKGAIKDVEGTITKPSVESSATKTINAIHIAQTGKSFDDGTPTTQKAALEEQQRRAVEVAGERARVTGKIKRTEEANKAIADLDNTSLIVETLDRLSGSIITADSAIAAAGQRVALTAGATAKTNEVAATYADQREQFTGVLSRSLGGEKGVLTDRDIARITKGLPQFGDTKRIRDFKMGTIRLLIDTAREAKLRLVDGRPQSPRIARRLDELFRRLEGGEESLTDVEKLSDEALDAAIKKAQRSR